MCQYFVFIYLTDKEQCRLRGPYILKPTAKVLKLKKFIMKFSRDYKISITIRCVKTRKTIFHILFRRKNGFPKITVGFNRCHQQQSLNVQSHSRTSSILFYICEFHLTVSLTGLLYSKLMKQLIQGLLQMKKWHFKVYVHVAK